MSQPPLSRRIRKLEDEIGAELFRRSRRRVILTPAGAELLRRSLHIIEEAEATIVATRRAARGLAGQLRIGFVSSALYSIVPEIVRRFSAKYPAVELSLHEAPTTSQLPLLEHHEIDVGLLRAPATHRYLRTTTVLRERLVVISPSGNEISKKTKLALHELRDEDFVMYARQTVPRLRDLVIQHCESAGFSPRIAQDATQIPMIISLVEAGRGVALVPESSRIAIRPGVSVAVLEDIIEIELLVATTREESSSLVQAFVHTASEVGRRAAERLQRPLPP